MNDFPRELLLHMSPALAIIAGLCITHAVNRVRARQRQAAERAGLSVALAGELRALREIYAENLDLIGRDAQTLMSTRGATPVYRGNVNRVAGVLDEKALAAVVAAYAHNEKIEALLACTGRHGHAAARKGAAEPVGVQEMKQRYARGLRAVALALAALAPDAPAPEARVRPAEKAAVLALVAADPAA